MEAARFYTDAAEIPKQINPTGLAFLISGVSTDLQGMVVRGRGDICVEREDIQ